MRAKAGARDGPYAIPREIDLGQVQRRWSSYLGSDDVAISAKPQLIIPRPRSETRKVTLVFSDGRETTYKADKQVVNFDQIKVGDRVEATVIEELAVFLGRSKVRLSAGAGAAIALAPKGARPGIVVADTAEVTATVMALDAAARTVTLQFVDGTRRTVKVGKDVDLTKVRPGDSLTAQLTEAVAILVEKS